MLEQSPMDKLGLYDLFEIFAKCHLQDILNFSEVSSYYNQVIDQPSFWITQFRQFGLECPDGEANRASFVKAYQSKANQLGREITFLKENKAELLKHFSNSIHFNKIAISLNFIIGKHDKLKDYSLNLKELDQVLEIFNRQLLNEQWPMPGWVHVSLNYLTRLKEDHLQQILAQTPQGLDAVNRIVHINLNGCLLEQLPETLKEFKHLESLNLYDTRLKSLPDFLADFNHLRQICISGGQFETLPKVLTRCESLRVLCMQENKMTTLPERPGRLRSLEVLFLHNNQLKALPESWFHLRYLKELTLDGNYLSLEQCQAVSKHYPNCPTVAEYLFEKQDKGNQELNAHPEIRSSRLHSADTMQSLLYQFNQLNLEQDQEDEEINRALLMHYGL